MNILIESLTPEQIQERRATLLAQAGMSLDRLREAGDAYRLDAEQRGILDKLEALEYLSSSD